MIYVEGGEFEMGSNLGDSHGNEMPLHRIKVNSFWMAEFPVTQAIWGYIMDKTVGLLPSYFRGDNRPIEYVSWQNIIEEFLL
ncbi:MAG: SUMF1/EgtB/PvdO family nonheme iron enzyme [Bacteroidetes bacterium]|nr:SUMF1/EgtB/PvdO family nonheme iron enzyme [Bacteroidota bacterium]